MEREEQKERNKKINEGKLKRRSPKKDNSNNSFEKKKALKRGN